jgi:hypothetical protein
MGQVTRKNLMVDADALRALARRRGTTESEAARAAIAAALAADEMVAALRGLHDLGAFAAFEELFAPPEEVVEDGGGAPARP